MAITGNLPPAEETEAWEEKEEEEEELPPLFNRLRPGIPILNTQSYS